MNEPRPLRRLFPILLLNLTGFAIAIPVLPALAYAVGGTALDVGLLYAVQSLGQFVMAPIWGSISDRLGRKPVLLATFAAAAILELVTAFIGSLALLYVARFFVGLCAGNVATASALIADSTPAEKRSRGMALIGISFGIGFTLGPALGAGVGWLATPGIAGPMGAGMPFIAAAIMNLIALVLGAWLLVESTGSPEDRRRNRRRLPTRKLTEQLRRPRVLLPTALFFFYTVSLTVLEGTFFIFMEARYGYDIVEVGLLFAAMGLVMVGFHGTVGPISRRLGDAPMVLLGVMTLGVGLLLAPIYPPLWFLLIFLVVASFGRAIVHPGVLSLISAQSDGNHETGQLMGVIQSAASLGRIIGPAVGGLLFFFISPAAPFYFAGALLLIAGPTWWVLRRRYH